MIETEKQAERAILIGLSYPGQNEQETQEYIDELSFLAETAGAIPVKRFIQKAEIPNPRTFVGTGKISEIAEFISDNKIDIAIFDDELSASQIRNIEKILNCRILDRTNLILDIFASRARTSYARTQVELAQYQYLLPRLAGMWTHLERQRGGIGLRGPGEKEIETDRRIIRDRITLLKEQLKKIDIQMSVQRKNRGKMVRVSLVGYTNVGKSTLMNLLGKSDVFAENKLFATLDTTVRKVVIGNLPFLLSDTVGFIRKLPHDLVESFKSTLDEIRESDLLMHIVDISHPGFEDQVRIVNETLRDLKSSGKPQILVFNKIDAFSFKAREEDDLTPLRKENYSLADLKKTWMANDMNHPVVFISAVTRENVDELRRILYEEVKKIHITRYPYNDFLFGDPATDDIL
ncbi:MAG TPA: GTPase HflX [Bacteroidales bacterium]|jgi:GTP-binding protein HflX|nr:GTPase HflX [Bacteroidales bacterium]OQB63067.1 MAG: GTPase HflX [Bacteroidetes bacterium ADurb.Bin145]HOU03499.1 GTPase HflX [Bacteroidales bacterium]HQG63458.1 GTPase HflX [Bacteroidales bacterium]HQK67638.1 GTPase HflX [Bacteroidales bacterium]